MAAVPSRKVKLVCSYGGKLQPSPIGDRLIYCGGESRLIIVDRDIQFNDLLRKLSSKCSVGNTGDVCVGLKYRLYGEDPSLLVSLTNDDDLENMMFEYDRNHRNYSAVKTVRIRLFLEVDKPPPTKNEAGSGLGSGSSSLNPDYLFGFDKEEDYSNVRDESALAEWKLPRDDYALAKDEQTDVVAAGAQQAQNNNNNEQVPVAYAGIVPSMYYYPPAYGWGMAPAAYVLVPAPAVPTAAVPRYCVL